MLQNACFRTVFQFLPAVCLHLAKWTVDVFQQIPALLCTTAQLQHIKGILFPFNISPRAECRKPDYTGLPFQVAYSRAKTKQRKVEGYSNHIYIYMLLLIINSRKSYRSSLRLYFTLLSMCK